MTSTADYLFDIMFAREFDCGRDFFWGCDFDDGALDGESARESESSYSWRGRECVYGSELTALFSAVSLHLLRLSS